MANPNLSARDIELVLAALKSTKTEFAIDYELFAQNAGFKNKRTASVMWSGLKKKLEAMRYADGAGPASPAGDGAGTPKSAKGGKKRKAAAEGTGGDDEEATPAPKKGKRSQKAEDQVKESIEGEDGVKAEPEDDFN